MKTRPTEVVYKGRRAVAMLLGGVPHNTPAMVRGIHEIWIQKDGPEGEREALRVLAEKLDLCGSSDVVVLPLYNIGDLRDNRRNGCAKVLPKPSVPRTEVRATLAFASGIPGPALGISNPTTP